MPTTPIIFYDYTLTSTGVYESDLFLLVYLSSFGEICLSHVLHTKGLSRRGTFSTLYPTYRLFPLLPYRINRVRLRLNHTTKIYPILDQTLTTLLSTHHRTLLRLFYHTNHLIFRRTIGMNYAMYHFRPRTPPSRVHRNEIIRRFIRLGIQMTIFRLYHFHFPPNARYHYALLILHNRPRLFNLLLFDVNTLRLTLRTIRLPHNFRTSTPLHHRHFVVFVILRPTIFRNVSRPIRITRIGTMNFNRRLTRLIRLQIFPSTLRHRPHDVLRNLFGLFQMLLRHLHGNVPTLFQYRLRIFFNFTTLLLLITLIQFDFLLHRPFNVSFNSLVRKTTTHEQLGIFFYHRFYYFTQPTTLHGPLLYKPRNEQYRQTTFTL